MMHCNNWERWIKDRLVLFVLYICAMTLPACSTVLVEPTTDYELLSLQEPLTLPPLPTKPGTKIKGTVGAGPGSLELTDAAGDKAVVHVDEEGHYDGFVEKENFKPIESTLELNDRSKTTWIMQDGSWKEQARTSSRPGLSSQSAGTGAAPILAGEDWPAYIRRLLDTDFIAQFGHSFTSGVNSTSRGALPGGPSFLQGSGESEASGFSYNFTLQHHFDRYMNHLGGSRPFLYFQGSNYHGLDGTGGAGISGTGLDQTSLTRTVSHAFGGGLGLSVPFYCRSGFHGGNNCFEISPFVGVLTVRQQLSATANEAGNVRTFQDNFYQVVPSGGVMLATPAIWKGVKLVGTYEASALNSAALSGSSFNGNSYDYRTDGGVVHNFWLGLSVNLREFGIGRF